MILKMEDKIDVKTLLSAFKLFKKNISLVSQDIILFDDTIKNNIAYAKENASLEEIEKACEFAANEFIKKCLRSLRPQLEKMV